MIIFGLSASEREGRALYTSCAHCSERKLVSRRRFRFFHLFFLPVLPLGAKSGVFCNHCRQLSWGKNVDAAARSDPGFVDGAASRPRWHFIGPAIAGLILVLTLFSGESERDIRSAAAAATPSIGDVWVVNIHRVIPELVVDLRYATARVDALEDGDIFLAFSDWQYDSWLTAYRKAKSAAEEQDPHYFTSTGIWLDPEVLAEHEKTGALTLAYSANTEGA